MHDRSESSALRLLGHLPVAHAPELFVRDGYWGATEQLWNAFHNCSYGKFTNMESLVPKGICKTLIVRQFWLRSALIFFA